MHGGMGGEHFNFLSHCIPCGAWCCRGERPYASHEELRLLQTPTIGQKPDGSCVFLQDNTCTAYANRPFECRIFPFDIQERGGKLWWVVWLVCPAQKEMDHEQVLRGFEERFPRRWPLIYIQAYVEHHKRHQPEKYSTMDFLVLREVRWT